MNKEQAQKYIELLKICKTGSTRAANKALKEIAEHLADNYAQSVVPPIGESLTEYQASRKKNFLLAAGYLKADDLIS